MSCGGSVRLFLQDQLSLFPLNIFKVVQQVDISKYISFSLSQRLSEYSFQLSPLG